MVLAGRRMRRALAAIGFALAAASCSPERGPGELFAPGGDNILVIDAMLVVGKPFPDVNLSRTLRPDQEFSWDGAGITGATITIEGGGSSAVYTDFPLPGRYIAETVTGPDEVFPGTTYRLTATLADGRVLRAVTTTPARIDVREWVLLNDEGTAVQQQLKTFTEDGDTVYSQPENQLVYPRGLLEARLAPTAAAAYQIGVQSLDLGSTLLIDADFLDEEDLDNFTRAGQSPPLDIAETNLRVPWFALYYEGRYKLRVFAMDRNWYDLARTDPVLGGGGSGGFGGATGDSTERPIFHVDGGIGLFGSMSADSVGFYINPPAP
jgi:hypothetical protein